MFRYCMVVFQSEQTTADVKHSITIYIKDTSLLNEILSLLSTYIQLKNYQDSGIVLSFPDSIIPPNNDWLSFDTMEFTRQLYLYENRLMCQITCDDLTCKNWLNLIGHNAQAIILHFNIFSRWVKRRILSEDNLQTRVKILERFIQIAEDCHTLKNYNGLIAILSSCNSNTVYRLKETWANISTSHRKIYDKLMILISAERSYQTLRKDQPNTDYIPYLGLFLTDLTFITEGNPGSYPDNQINNYKLYLETNTIQRFFMCINRRQKFRKVEIIYNFIDNLQNLPTWTDSEEYSRSLELEKRKPT